jgi:hypothetical protein
VNSESFAGSACCARHGSQLQGTQRARLPWLAPGGGARTTWAAVHIVSSFFLVARRFRSCRSGAGLLSRLETCLPWDRPYRGPSSFSNHDIARCAYVVRCNARRLRRRSQAGWQRRQQEANHQFALQMVDVSTDVAGQLQTKQYRREKIFGLCDPISPFRTPGSVRPDRPLLITHPPTRAECTQAIAASCKKKVRAVLRSDGTVSGTCWCPQGIESGPGAEMVDRNM